LKDFFQAADDLDSSSVTGSRLNFCHVDFEPWYARILNFRLMLATVLRVQSIRAPISEIDMSVSESKVMIR
jgi:hypothetical protein